VLLVYSRISQLNLVGYKSGTIFYNNNVYYSLRSQKIVNNNVLTRYINMKIRGKYQAVSARCAIQIALMPVTGKESAMGCSLVDRDQIDGRNTEK
jgi:hypothetical protein